MQDYNYLYSNCFEITFYLSCCKYPDRKFLPFYWYANLESMLKFIESTRLGVFGQVKDTAGRRVRWAVISVKGYAKRVKGTKKGEYWRLLGEGNYTLTASAYGYVGQTKEVEVSQEHPYVRLDFELVFRQRCLGFLGL